MPDFATSTAPEVQAQLDRLWALSPGTDILGLERITALLAKIGDPHLALPPILHVAGTNGKGSTCAYLRAAIEAAGLRAHVYTSPHLVRFNERIRLAGALIDDAALAVLLKDVLDRADGIGASFFEVTTAAAFLAFSRTPADACVVEVGLGGRLDATNVVPAPAVTGIAQLGIDHQAFLGGTIEQIAGEKAGIAKAGVPLVTMGYAEPVARVIAKSAAMAGAPWFARDTAWRSSTGPAGLHYEDARGVVDTPLPRLAGAHQAQNLALAIAMLRHQTALTIPDSAHGAAAEWARWPARMQALEAGPIRDILPAGSALWLDGGHNADAAIAIRDVLRSKADGRPVHLVMGMLANKDARAFLRALALAVRSLHAVPVPGHAHHAPDALMQIAADFALFGQGEADVPSALRAIAKRADPANPPVVLITGTLYLAGAVLEANGQVPR